MIAASIDAFRGVLDGVDRSARIVVCGHRNPDGDCMGSILALTLALRGAGYEAVPVLSEPEQEDGLFAFLPGYGLFVEAGDYEGDPDVAFGVDVPDTDRMGQAQPVFERAHRKFGIDHHPGTKDYGETVYSDPTAAAAGMLVWDLIDALGLETDANIATCLYVALLTDTGRFQFQNTDGRAFRYAALFLEAGADPSYCATMVYQNRHVAALRLEQIVLEHMELLHDGTFAYSWVADADLERVHATRDDTEGLIDTIRCIHGVEIALLMHVHADSIRCSLRAKTDADVSAIAAALGGGGHRAAAGFTSHTSVDETVAAVLALLAGADCGQSSEDGASA